MEGSSLIDTTEIVSTINGALEPVGAVGTAVLIVLSSIMVFGLIKRAMGR